VPVCRKNCRRVIAALYASNVVCQSGGDACIGSNSKRQKIIETETRLCGPALSVAARNKDFGYWELFGIWTFGVCDF
jgi:hypothetical protein